jgi:chemotaxis protein methyltransferase CheR
VSAARSSAERGISVLGQSQFEWLRNMLAEYGGFFLDAGQRRALDVGVAQRAEALHCDREHYLDLLRGPQGREELQRLIELLLNHETFFFRNRPHLHALQHVLLPEVHRAKPAGLPIRIWSAGCASGEEAYSIAIVALEALGPQANRPVEVIATDLSAAALQRGMAGWYRGRTMQNVAPELLTRYFEPHGDGYLVRESVRDMVRFRQMNLLDSFPDFVQRVDAIFCQNVTIYFQAAARRQLIERFYACLPSGGLLFLGFSETLWNIFDGFRTREVGGAYVYYKESHSRPKEPHSRPAPQVHKQRATPARKVAQPRPEPHARSARPASKPADMAVLAEARSLLNGGQVSDALDVLRRIAPQSPLAVEALNLAARAHADRGDLEQAGAEAIRALEIDSLNDTAYLLLGIVYARQSQWQLSAQQLERARYLRPESALVSFHLAAAYSELGLGEQARREYRSTLWKLRDDPPDSLLDGVAVAWLRDTCEREIERLARGATK